MGIEYYSDSINSHQARTCEEISETAWGGIVALLQSRINDGSFGYRYPAKCYDNPIICGCDEQSFELAIQSEIKGLTWPLEPYLVPPLMTILDLVQFCYDKVGFPIEIEFHKNLQHKHLSFNQDKGQKQFWEEINRIFMRNNLAYELRLDGRIHRINNTILQASIDSVLFKTADAKLNELLTIACEKFLSPDPIIRKEGLDKLWDGWERLKTIEEGKDKKDQTRSMLQRVSPDEHFYEELNSEGLALTKIGNNFQIRHLEMGKHPITDNKHVDYLFHRLFALIKLCLEKINTD